MIRLILSTASLLVATAGFAAGIKELPKKIEWQSKVLKAEELIASPKAKVGGTLRDGLSTFPLTLRQVGPDSNGSFRSFMDLNDMSPVTMHPNTNEFLPELASHWAFHPNGRTVLYRLNPIAKWSDGKPVTGADFEFTLEFFRSQHIVAPWYNTYYSEQIENIQAFKDKDGREVVAVTLPKAVPDLLYYTNISPQPKHFFKLDKDFVKNYNWKVKPNNGPYEIDKVRKGKFITFKRKENWWGFQLPWFKNRFNIKRVKLEIIRDPSVSFEYLKKGKLDYMMVNFPDYWHEKTQAEEFKKGYIHKMMFYNDMPRSDYVLTLNEKFSFFADQRVREAFHYAMNVDKVINQVLRGDYDRLQGISRGYGEYSNPKIKARPFDLKKADALLKAAGWTKRNGQGIRVKGNQTLSATITYSQPNIAPRLVVLREEAKKAGIELKLKQLDASAMWKSFLEKKHEIAFVGWSTRFRPQYWGQYHSANANKPQTNNFSNTDDKQLDKLIESYRASTSDKERISLAHQIQARIHELAIQIPLFKVPYFRVAYWAWIQFPDVPATKSSDSFDYFGSSTGGLMWIDGELKKAIQKASRKGKKLDPVTRVETNYKS